MRTSAAVGAGESLFNKFRKKKNMFNAMRFAFANMQKHIAIFAFQREREREIKKVCMLCKKVPFAFRLFDCV